MLDKVRRRQADRLQITLHHPEFDLLQLSVELRFLLVDLRELRFDTLLFAFQRLG
jgi:hypothetical protein